MNNMTRAELIAYCEENGIDYPGGAGKNKLEAIVNEYRKSHPDPVDVIDPVPDHDPAPVHATVPVQNPDQQKKQNVIPELASDHESISKHEPEKIKKTYINNSNTKLKLFDVWIKPGEKITPTDMQLLSEKNIKRASRAVSLGMLKEI